MSESGTKKPPHKVPTLCQVLGLMRRLNTAKLIRVVGSDLGRFTKVSLNVDKEDVAVALEAHPILKRFL